MLPWPVCPLAGHARLGQNVVAGSMRLLLSWLCWGACQEGVCLDPHFHCNCTSPRFSGELPRCKIMLFIGNTTPQSSDLLIRAEMASLNQSKGSKPPAASAVRP